MQTNIKNTEPKSKPNTSVHKQKTKTKNNWPQAPTEHKTTKIYQGNHKAPEQQQENGEHGWHGNQIWLISTSLIKLIAVDRKSLAPLDSCFLAYSLQGFHHLRGCRVSSVHCWEAYEKMKNMKGSKRTLTKSNETSWKWQKYIPSETSTWHAWDGMHGTRILISLCD